ncbi:MAG: hypothetical protein IBX56_16195 [Methylomicrobium sp.]|nr:hypothetical protein [Methylomicrobium sp.]
MASAPQPGIAVSQPPRRSEVGACGHHATGSWRRAKLLDAINHEGLELPERYPETWVVDVKSVGNGAHGNGFRLK